MFPSSENLLQWYAIKIATYVLLYGKLLQASLSVNFNVLPRLKFSGILHVCRASALEIECITDHA